MPVPVRLTVCGLLEALSEMLTDALLAPVLVGVKVTLIEQFAVAARVLPQVFVSAKSPAFVPVTPIVTSVREALPVLVSVTDC